MAARGHYCSIALIFVAVFSSTLGASFHGKTDEPILSFDHDKFGQFLDSVKASLVQGLQRFVTNSNKTTSATLSGDFWAKLKQELVRDEGEVLHIYLDSLGNPTFGIGHLIVRSDPEYGKPVNTPVSQARVDQAYNQDANTAVSSAKKLFPNFNDIPELADIVLSDIMFNIGYNSFSQFHDFRAAEAKKDWNAAADALVDSKWYHQVGIRGKRLVAELRSLAPHK